MKNRRALVRIWSIYGTVALSLVLGMGVLLSATVWAALKVFGGDYSLSLEPTALLAVLSLCLIAVEWPWSGRWSRAVALLLRFAVLGVTLVWLLWCLFLARPTRSALMAENAVTEVGPGELSSYASGVYTMAREVAVGVSEAWLPILVLFWLAGIPGLRATRQLWRDHVSDRPSHDG